MASLEISRTVRGYSPPRPSLIMISWRTQSSVRTAAFIVGALSELSASFIVSTLQPLQPDRRTKRIMSHRMKLVSSPVWWSATKVGTKKRPRRIAPTVKRRSQLIAGGLSEENCGRHLSVKPSRELYRCTQTSCSRPKTSGVRPVPRQTTSRVSQAGGTWQQCLSRESLVLLATPCSRCRGRAALELCN